jgi:hypothetical protein
LTARAFRAVTGASAGQPQPLEGGKARAIIPNLLGKLPGSVIGGIRFRRRAVTVPRDRKERP